MKITEKMLRAAGIIFTAALILTVLSPATLLGKAVDVPQERLLCGFESTSQIGWHDNDILLTPSADTAVQGENSMRLSMKSKANWKGISIPLGDSGALTDAKSLIFYYKSPTGASTNNSWFQIFYEYSGVQLTHNGDFSIYIRDKDSSEWKKTTYWNNYGPNIPYGFDGYIMIPLTGALKVSYTTVGETEAKLNNVNSLLLFFSNFGGTNGDIILDDLKCSTSNNTSPGGGGENDGPQYKGNMQILLDLENRAAGDSVKKTNDNPGGIVTFTANPRDFEADVSDAVSADGTNSIRINSLVEQTFAQLLLALPSPVDEKTKSIIMYVKAPEFSSEKDFNFTIGALVSGGDYKLDNCNVLVLKRGKNKWSEAKYIADWGTSLGGGFEGYIQFMLDDLIPAYSNDKNNPIPDKIVPKNINALNFWVHNFGGGDDNSAFYLDAFYANLSEPDNHDFFALVKENFYKEDLGSGNQNGEWAGDSVAEPYLYEWIADLDTVSPDDALPSTGDENLIIETQMLFAAAFVIAAVTGYILKKRYS